MCPALQVMHPVHVPVSLGNCSKNNQWQVLPHVSPSKKCSSGCCEYSTCFPQSLSEEPMTYRRPRRLLHRIALRRDTSTPTPTNDHHQCSFPLPCYQKTSDSPLIKTTSSPLELQTRRCSLSVWPDKLYGFHPSRHWTAMSFTQNLQIPTERIPTGGRDHYREPCGEAGRVWVGDRCHKRGAYEAKHSANALYLDRPPCNRFDIKGVIHPKITHYCKTDTACIAEHMPPAGAFVWLFESFAFP